MLLRRVIGEFELELIFLDEPKFPRPVTPNVSKTSSAECLTHSKWAYKNTNHHDHNLTTIVHQHPHIVPLTKKNRGILPRRNK